MKAKIENITISYGEKKILVVSLEEAKVILEALQEIITPNPVPIWRDQILGPKRGSEIESQPLKHPPWPLEHPFSITPKEPFQPDEGIFYSEEFKSLNTPVTGSATIPPHIQDFIQDQADKQKKLLDSFKGPDNLSFEH